MKKLIKIFCVIIAVGLVCGLAYAYNERLNDNVRLTEYIYSDEKIPKAFNGYKIFVISDLHNAPFSNQIIEEINTVNPDIIVFTGDMVQLPDSDISESIKIAKEFEDKIPVYAVSGNHETQNREYWEIYDTLHYSADVDWLEGYTAELEKAGETITLAGIADPEYDNLCGDDIKHIRKKIVEELDESAGFTILLNHRAGLYPDIKDLGVNLIISGDLHGGIIRLPIIGGIWSKKEDWNLPQYEYGMIAEDGYSTMIVSGGCDKNPDKKRWFNPPEVLLITLESE